MTTETKNLKSNPVTPPTRGSGDVRFGAAKTAAAADAAREQSKLGVKRGVLYSGFAPL